MPVSELLVLLRDRLQVRTRTRARAVLSRLLPRSLFRRLRRAVPQTPLDNWFPDDTSADGRRASGGPGGKRRSGENAIPEKRYRFLRSRLWGGFSEDAIAGLEALKRDRGAGPNARLQAALELGRWYRAIGEPERALVQWRDAELIAPREVHDEPNVRSWAHLLAESGHYDEAQGLVATIAATHFDPELLLLRANCVPREDGLFRSPDDEAGVLGHLNRIYEHFGLSTLAVRDPQQPLSLDNLTGCDGLSAVERGPLVSVLVPAFNAAATIETTLRGLAEQTWSSFEAIIVDDASDDATPEIVRAFAAQDQRFRLIQRRENGGAYVARNEGLAVAAGEYVTVQDAGDWPHPDRLRLQVEDLESSSVQLNWVHWIRATPALHLRGAPFADGDSVAHESFSSLMFRAELFNLVGMWDEVRVGADSELRYRQALFTGATPRLVSAGCPLVYGRLESCSLTTHPSTNVYTLKHGVRREYQESWQQWHGEFVKGDHSSDTPDPRTERLISRPAPLRVDLGSQLPRLDVLIVSDWTLRDAVIWSGFTMLEAAVGAELWTGLLHVPHFQQSDLRIPKTLRSWCSERNVRIVAPGEQVSVSKVVFAFPNSLNFRMDKFPELNLEASALVINEFAERDIHGHDILYDPKRVRNVIESYVGDSSQWIAVSPLLQQLVNADPRYPDASPDVWYPLTRSKNVHRVRPRWRGGARRDPIIGLHDCDDRLKWPETEMAARSALCAETAAEVRFLGGTRGSAKQLTRWARNWTTSGSSEDELAFLADLDFFIHYPHPDRIDASNRVVIEAFGQGVPAILPPRFEESFGEAAVYADPEDVWTVLSELWCNQSEYIDQAMRGIDFLIKNCSPTNFMTRLENLCR